MKKNILKLVLIAGLGVVLSTGCSKDDTTSPSITLNGDATVIIGKGDTYADPGATAVDDEDDSPTVTSDFATVLDVNTPDEYVITYTATDEDGNSSSVTRTVIVSFRGSDVNATYTSSYRDSTQDTVITDSSVPSTVSTSTSEFSFLFSSVYLGSINNVKADVMGHHFTIAQQKPNGASSAFTVQGVGEGRIEMNGSTIELDFQVMITDSTIPNDVLVVYETIHSESQ